MWKVVVASIVLVTTVPCFRIVADACGDKFLKVGHSARFNKVYAAIYPATIVVYSPSGGAASAAVLDQKFQSSLIRAGHRVEVVRHQEQLAAALQAGRVDLVLAGVADVEAIAPVAEQSPSKPAVLPVLRNPTKAEAEAVKARYHVELKTSDTPARYLSALDDTMHARVRQRTGRK